MNRFNTINERTKAKLTINVGYFARGQKDKQDESYIIPFIF
jgi:hypothetical protein